MMNKRAEVPTAEELREEVQYAEAAVVLDDNDDDEHTSG
jgi:hypothetical protein